MSVGFTPDRAGVVCGHKFVACDPGAHSGQLLSLRCSRRPVDVASLHSSLCRSTLSYCPLAFLRRRCSMSFACDGQQGASCKGRTMMYRRWVWTILSLPVVLTVPTLGTAATFRVSAGDVAGLIAAIHAGISAGGYSEVHLFFSLKRGIQLWALNVLFHGGRVMY